MKTIYMLSGPMKYKGFPEEIKELLLEDLTNKKNIVFFPTSPDNFEKNDKYVFGNDNINGINNYLSEISSLKNVNIIDDRVSNEIAIGLIKNADILYLLGGNPFIQLEYLKKNKYDKLIKEFSGLIIGTSAGAMNLGKIAYYSKDEDYPITCFYEGLGLVNITVDPHFNIEDKEQIMEAINNSYEHVIIGLPNDSGIRITSNKIQFINKCYSFKNGLQEEINSKRKNK